MPLYVLQVACEFCNGVHPTNDVIKLDDGPQTKETVAGFYANRPVPADVAVRNQTFRCPTTGQAFSPMSDDKVYIVPAPYRL
jgi:hypothetical protein